jgi:hypothetical protein
VTRGNERISLTTTEFDLASRGPPGRVYTRTQLLELVRDYEALEADERTINVHVSHIRDKIEPDPAQPRYIKTVRGVGYAFSETDPPGPGRWPPPSPLGLMQRLNVRLVIALASVAVLALLVSGATLNQILPGLFVSQAEDRAEVAAAATILLIQEQAAGESAEVMLTPELRNTKFLQPLAQAAANTLVQGRAISRG